MLDEDRETRYYNVINGRVEQRCKYCPKTFILSSGTATITNHLTWPDADGGHNIPYQSLRDIQVQGQQERIDIAMDQANRHPKKRRKLGPSDVDALDGTTLEVLQVNVLAACSLALRLICVPEFRAFLAYLNSNMNVWLPTSSTTIYEQVIR